MRLLTAQSRQKSYANRRRWRIEFKEGDHVFLKVMPKRGMVRFGKREKLSPRYIEPFEILERVGTIAYQLALPSSLLVYRVSTKYSMSPCSENTLQIRFT